MTDEEKKPIIAYKGFDQNLCCKDMQYEVGKEYKHDGEVKPCESGFHACIEPLDVFDYYVPGTSRFCEVEVGGKIVPDGDKIACENLKVIREIPIGEFVGICVERKIKNVLANLIDPPSNETGNQSAASNTGNQSAASNTGYRSAASNTGDQSAASNTGDQSAASNTGNQSAASNTGYRFY